MLRKKSYTNKPFTIVIYYCKYITLNKKNFFRDLLEYFIYWEEKLYKLNTSIFLPSL
jgi:hypothetical protein